MNNLNSLNDSIEGSQPITIGVFGGGSAGKTANGLLDAVEAGIVPGVDSALVFVAVGTADDGGGTGRLRNIYDIPAVGDLRRSISNVSANQDAALDFERRFDALSTAEDVAVAGAQLLATLSYTKQSMTDERSAELIKSAVIISQDIINKDKDGLKNLAFGHLVLAALTLESGIDQATYDAGELMQTRAIVIPVSLDNHYLKLRDGKDIIVGQHEIDKRPLQNPRDFTVSLCSDKDGHHGDVNANPRLLKFMKFATQLVIGPGSELTSNIPAILPDGVPAELKTAIVDPDRDVFLLGNITQQPGITPTTYLKSTYEHGRVIGQLPDLTIGNSDVGGLKDPVLRGNDTVLESMPIPNIVQLPIRGSREPAYQKDDALAEAGRRSNVEHDMAVVTLAMGDRLVTRRNQVSPKVLVNA